MENSLRMVLSSRLIEESLSLDLPFFTRLSTVLDQMGLQAVKQGQITDNWQKRAPWLLIEDNQSLCCGHGAPLASVWELIRDQGQIQPSLLLQEHFQSRLLPCIIKQPRPPPPPFLSWVAAHCQTRSQTLWHWVRSVWICQSSGWDATQDFLCSRRMRASHTGSNLKTRLQGNTSKWNARFILAKDAVFSQETAPQQ